MKTLYECRSGYSIALLTERGEIARLVSVLESIGLDEGWQPGDFIQSYAAAAHHIAAIRDGEIRGGIQVMLGKVSKPFSFETIWPEAIPRNPALVAHIAVLALVKTARGGDGPFFPLCAELWRICHWEEVKELWLETTPDNLALYRRLGWPLEVVGEARLHMGEICYLARMHMGAVEGSLFQKALGSPSTSRLVEQATRETLLA